LPNAQIRETLHLPRSLLENDGTEQKNNSRDEDEGDDSGRCYDDHFAVLTLFQQCGINWELINNLIMKSLF